ncbi:histidine kinase N-terminal 7TM domain-containing protein [Spirochaetota bacterium]
MFLGLPLYTYLLFISTAIAVILAFYGFLRQTDKTGYYFFLLMLAVAHWCFFHSLEVATSIPYYKILMAKIQYFGIASVPVLWFLLALSYSNNSREIIKKVNIFLWIIPIASIIMAFTNSFHSLLWSDITPIKKTITYISYGIHLVFVHGPWFWVIIGYSYILLLLGSMLLIYEAVKSKHLYRHQPIVMITGVIFPWVANFLYITRLDPIPDVDFTCLAFSLSGVFVGWGIFRFKLLNVLPIARDQIIEHMNDGVLVIDENNFLVDINNRARELSGIGENIKIGENFNLENNPLKEIIESRDNKKKNLFEFKINNSHEIVLEIHADPIHDRFGRYRGRLMILHDITERKKNEESLKMLHGAVEQSPALVMITNKKGIIGYINPKFTEVTGYEPEDVIGHNPRILKSGNKSPEDYKNLWKTISAGKTWRGEFYNRKKNGDCYWEQASISPILNEKGDITSFVAVKEDISRRKTAEDALRQNEEKLRIRNETMERELESARIIQRSFLPTKIPEAPHLNVAFRYIPLEAVGGDFLTFTDFREKGFGVFLGDVAGHGVSAALLTSMLKVINKRVSRRWIQYPREYMINLNQLLYNYKFQQYITAIYGFFDISVSGNVSFRFSNGGHPYPIIFNAGTGEADYIKCKGMLVGYFPSPEFNQEEVALSKGDRVFLYTDGLIDTENTKGEYVGFEYAVELVKLNQKNTIEETLDSIIHALNEFRGDALIQDDLVIIGIEVV